MWQLDGVLDWDFGLILGLVVVGLLSVVMAARKLMRGR